MPIDSASTRSSGSFLPDLHEAIAVANHLHVVVVVAILAADGKGDGALRRRQQPFEHGRLEQRVAVQQHKRLLHLDAGDPAAHQIVGGREERVVQRADPARPVDLGEPRLDRLGAESDHHRDILDAAPGEGVDLPLDQRPPSHREHALRNALGKRQQSAALTGAQDNRFHPWFTPLRQNPTARRAKASRFGAARKKPLVSLAAPQNSNPGSANRSCLPRKCDPGGSPREAGRSSWPIRSGEPFGKMWTL